MPKGRVAAVRHQILRHLREALVMFLTTALGIATCFTGCSNRRDPTSPNGVVGPQPSPVVTDSACTRLEFTFTEGGIISTITPDRSICGAGLILIPGGTATRAVRQANIPVRFLNRSGSPVQLPARLLLSPTGKVVLAPSGQPISLIGLVNPDSVLSGEVRLWRIGGTGLLQPGDSTSAKTLQITLANPGSQARLNFSVTAEMTPAGVPPTAPNSRPAWFGKDSSWTAGDSVALKRALAVDFVPGATVAQKQGAIDSVQGVVIGGRPWITAPAEGTYYISVPNATTFAQLMVAVAILRRQSSVKNAYPLFRVVPSGRRPSDTTTWKRADWTFNPDSSSGNNWMFEDVAMPLAWGCETGSSQVRIGVVDELFKLGGFSSNVLGSVPYSTDPLVVVPHGNVVASVIGAVGNDGLGMAGINWKTGLRLVAVGQVANVDDVIHATDSVLSLGVEVLNLSVVMPLNTADSTARDVGNLFVGVLRRHASSLPLVVVAAGNVNADAKLSGFTRARDSFPSQVIVVGGSAPRNGLVRNRWGGNSFATGQGAGSSWGTLLDVYAPAYQVAYWNDSDGSFYTSNGTSFSAPMVAGVAGLLKSFDPSLTSAQLKTLIVTGASAGHRSMLNDPTKYLINAYESLKLAAAVPGTPICGNVVFADTLNRLVVKRGVTDEVIYNTSLVVGDVSVAQGGRLVGFTEYRPTQPQGFQQSGVKTIAFAGGVWFGGTAQSYQRVQYLEFDTAYSGSATSWANELTVKRAAGPNTVNLDLRNGVTTGVVMKSDVSWNGRWVAFQADLGQGHNFYVDSVGRNQPVLARQHWDGIDCQYLQTHCDDVVVSFQQAVWRHDDRSIVFLDNRGDRLPLPAAFRMGFVQVKLPDSVSQQTTVTQVTVQDRHGFAARFAIDDGLFTATEIVGGVCRTVTRIPTTFAVILDSPGDFDNCRLMETNVANTPNAPPWASMLSGSGAARGRDVRTRSTRGN